MIFMLTYIHGFSKIIRIFMHTVLNRMAEMQMFRIFQL